MLSWQISALIEAGIERLVVVTGFGAAQVEQELSSLSSGAHVRTIFNPFYAVSDNLGSVWLAREEMDEDFLLINGDTLFDATVVPHVLANAPGTVNVTVSRSTAYDADAMKVRLDRDRLLEIGKTLDSDCTNAESIGMILFRGTGPEIFRDALEEAARQADAIRRWYLSVIDALAGSSPVHAVEIAADAWCEVDFPVDLKLAREAVGRWGGPRSALAVAAGRK